MSNEWLLLVEVAKEARVSVSTVRFWIGSGKLASVRPGRRRLVRRSDLAEFLTRGASAISVAATSSGDPRQVPLTFTGARPGGAPGGEKPHGGS